MNVMLPAGVAAERIADLGWALFIGATVIFIGVMALLAVALVRDGATVRAGRWVIGGGVALPVVLLTVLMVHSAVTGGQLQQAAPKDTLIIEVTGRMWWWEVRYRDPATGRDVALANEIRVPVGRPVVLGLTTADVIHSFWVPQLAGKVDMVPGRVNQLNVQATRAGTYRGQCAEYCGEQHASMALHVVALEAAEFDAWLAAQARPAAEPEDAPAVGPGASLPFSPYAASAVVETTADAALRQRGKQAFMVHRCTACHTVRGVSEEGRLGPDLTHVGSRIYLGAGVLKNHRDALAQWTSAVQQLKPGARMPSFDRLDPATLDAIAAYLDHLK